MTPEPEITLAERVASYASCFPAYPPMSISGGWMQGLWFLGQNFARATDLHGAFNGNVLERILSLFPDIPRWRMMHIFAGRVKRDDWWRVDLIDRTLYRDSAERDPRFILQDVQTLGSLRDSHHIEGAFLRSGRPRLFIADPPYTREDAKKYGFPMVNRQKCLQSIADYADPGAWLVWYDIREPQWSREQWDFRGFVCVRISCMKLIRSALILQRKPCSDPK